MLVLSQIIRKQQLSILYALLPPALLQQTFGVPVLHAYTHW